MSRLRRSTSLIPDGVRARLVLPIVAVLAATGVSSSARGDDLACGVPAPDFCVRGLLDHGEVEMTSASFRGKWLLLEFWATWCGPSLECVQRLKEIDSKFSGEGLAVLAVSDETIPQIRGFLATHPRPYKAASADGSDMFKTYGVTAVPVSLLVDPEGMIRWIGDVRYLRNAVLDDAMKRKTHPKSLYRNMSQATADRAQSTFILEIGYSRKPGQASILEGPTGYQFECQGRSVFDMLAYLLRAGSHRIVNESNLPAIKLDVKYFHEPPVGDERQALAQAICRELGLELRTREETRLAWVVTLDQAADRRPDALPQKQKEPRPGQVQPIMRPFAEIIAEVAFRCDTPIVDKTGLSGEYLFQMGSRPNFEASRRELSERFGCEFEEQEVPISVYVVSKRSVKTRSSP